MVAQAHHFFFLRCAVRSLALFGYLVQVNSLPMLLKLPRLFDYTGGYAMLGLGDIVSRSAMPAGEGASEAGSIVWDVIALPFKVPSMIRAGEIEASDARPVSVYGISQIAGDQLAAGDWFNILFFTGIISAGLGFANLLPLPALDGGRIIFVLIEAIRGKRVSPRVEQMVHTAGMVLLLTLTVFLIFQDIINPVIP